MTNPASRTFAGLSPVLFFALVVLLAGCASMEKKPDVPDSSLGAYIATKDQTFIAAARAAASYDRLDEAQKKLMEKTGVEYLAVRTLDPDPAQLAAIQQKAKSLAGPDASAGGPFYCVMIWDIKTQKIIGTDCYAVGSVIGVNSIARFGAFKTQYVGSF